MIPGLAQGGFGSSGGLWEVFYSSGASYVSTYPGGLQDGDIAFIVAASGATSTATPTGATTLASSGGSSPNRSYRIAYRRVGPTENGTAIGGGGNRKLIVFRLSNRTLFPVLNELYNVLNNSANVYATVDYSDYQTPVSMIALAGRSENSNFVDQGFVQLDGVTMTMLQAESIPGGNIYARAQLWYSLGNQTPRSVEYRFNRGSRGADHNNYIALNLSRS